jgi:hypothetical protein
MVRPQYRKYSQDHQTSNCILSEELLLSALTGGAPARQAEFGTPDACKQVETVTPTPAMNIRPASPASDMVERPLALLTQLRKSGGGRMMSGLSLIKKSARL